MRFMKLQSASKIKQQLIELVQTDSGWFKSNGFTILDVPDRIIMLDPVLVMLKLKFRGRAIIFHMPPNTFYRFHTDEHRQSAINMLISGEESHCYYGDVTDTEEVVNNLSELVYENSAYYLMNTHHKHAVLNLNNHRYMLSLGFNNFNYNDVESFCLENML